MMVDTIMVTGASGFIAKHIVLQLLEAGYKVRGSVRSDKREKEVRKAIAAHLDPAINLDKLLEIVRLDLGDDKGWSEALIGVDALMHTASPVTFEMLEDEQDLIRPAVDGTLRALRAAQAAGVKRVILTSSVSAIIAKEKTGTDKFDESDWTDVTHPKASQYDKSKTLAERAAWDFVVDNPDIELTTINPGMVWGAPLDGVYGTSLELIERVMSGKDMALPNKGFPVVNVRDVAVMHVKSLQTPAVIGERIIAAAGWYWLKDVALVLKNEFPHRKFSTMVAPNFLIRMIAIFDKDIRQIIPSLGQDESVSNAKAISMLGMSFIDPEVSLIEAAKVVEKHGLTLG